jgi:putative ABC transport system permease protein
MWALQTLWYERKRYWAGVMAVAFSVVLIAVQNGLVSGLMRMVSFPVDLSNADVWVAGPKVQSCDLGSVFDRDVLNRIVVRPEVERIDEYLQGFTFWKQPEVGQKLVIVAGCELDDGSLGPVNTLSAELRGRLSEPGAVVINEKDRTKLGVKEIGDSATVFGFRVRVVGFTSNTASFTGPYILCSLRTARQLLGLEPDKTYYLLVKTKEPSEARWLARDIAADSRVEAYTAEEFSQKSRWYWMRTTNAGIAMGFVGLLGLAVGAVITSQTLYAATVSSLRELMVLRALGIPRMRIVRFVLAQAFFVGLLGVLFGIPISFAVARIGEAIGTKPVIDGLLVLVTAGIAMATAGLAGLVALRSLANVEPVQLLR